MNTQTENHPQTATHRFKMLNGHCVPISTPDNYFALSAAQWLKNLGELVKAGRSLQQSNIEREQARIEYEIEV